MLSQPLAPDLGLGALCLMPLCEAASINSLQKTSASVAFCAEKAHEQPLGVWRLARGQPQNIFLKKNARCRHSCRSICRKREAEA